jgi:peptide deformylase
MPGKLLPILKYPDPRLQIPAAAVPLSQIDDSLQKLCDDMLATIYATKSIGLAATQVNVPKRLMVIDVSAEQNTPLVFINPEILSHGTPGMSEEQCLSVPGFSDKVARSLRLTVRAIDRNGSPFELAAEGLLAVCIQHEIDHLNGKLFIDYLSCLKRARLRRRLAARPAAASAT